jgi:hypothetical protein
MTFIPPPLATKNNLAGIMTVFVETVRKLTG